jgi:hypothetical protein
MNNTKGVGTTTTSDTARRPPPHSLGDGRKRIPTADVDVRKVGIIVMIIFINSKPLRSIICHPLMHPRHPNEILKMNNIKKEDIIIIKAGIM